MKRSSRSGLSLLEVLLATSILLGSSIILFELAAIGRAHIESAEDLAEAQRICETRINEMLAGVTPIQIVENEPLDDSDWSVSVQLDPVSHLAGLAALRVTVTREASAGHRGKTYTLVRWIHDPLASQDASQPTSPAPAPFAGQPTPETPPEVLP